MEGHRDEIVVTSCGLVARSSSLEAGNWGRPICIKCPSLYPACGARGLLAHPRALQECGHTTYFQRAHASCCGGSDGRALPPASEAWVRSKDASHGHALCLLGWLSLRVYVRDSDRHTALIHETAAQSAAVMLLHYLDCYVTVFISNGQPKEDPMAICSAYTVAHVRLAAEAGDLEGARRIADTLNLSQKEREAMGLKNSDSESDNTEGQKSDDVSALLSIYPPSSLKVAIPFRFLKPFRYGFAPAQV